MKQIEAVIRVLRDREREGEGSKFDRLRTEWERAELLAERASGEIETPPLVLNAGDLTRRALAAREDYRAEQRRMEQYRLERRAAERLRFPESVLTAGLKRTEILPRYVANGPAVGIVVPLPYSTKVKPKLPDSRRSCNDLQHGFKRSRNRFEQRSRARCSH